MTTRNTTHATSTAPTKASDRARAERNRRRYRIGAWAGSLVLIASIVTVGLLTSRPEASSAERVAPAFTLPTTAGTNVSLSDYRGRSVILYFSEGAGCGACTAQLVAIEKQKQAFDDAGLTVLPIVMNTRAQIQPDLDQYGATSPVLLDDGTVSRAYDTLGKGMHAELPGHSFILIDSKGTEIWNGDYPSMWLEPQELLKLATSILGA